MTAAEYRRLYRKARDGFEPMTQETMSRIRGVMQEASEHVSEAVSRAKRLNQSALTRGSLEEIEMQLNRAAQAIAESTFDETGKLISSAYTTYADVDTEYLSDSIRLTGAQSRVTVAGVKNMVVGVNRQLISDLVTRTYQDGYTFSDRVFLDMIPRTLKSGREVLTPGGVFGDYQHRVRNLINTGVVQGRDPVQIAKDIEIYVRQSLLDAGVDTKDIVFSPGRFGRLEPGTREFARRVASRPDWRALRLVRSELYASMQSSSVRATRINPATTNMVDWILTPGVQHDCICIDLEENSPYHVDNVPEYPHPNCFCTIIPQLRDGNEFNRDLQRWVRGDNVGYLDTWHRETYLPAQIQST